MPANPTTPGQLTRRSEFYQQLGQFLSAGVDITTALKHLRTHGIGRDYGVAIDSLLASISSGSTFTESLQALPGWFPDFDLALLNAGEQSGRLDASLKLLAAYYQERASLLREVIGGLAYPAFLLHFAVFILPFPGLFVSGDLSAYLRSTLSVLIPIYLVAGLLWYAVHSQHGAGWRSLLERISSHLPLLGSARQCLALSRLSAALEGLISAGVNILEAWPLSAAASGSPRIQRTVEAWRPLLDAGKTPAELVADSACFPELFASHYATGEASGRLDDNLERLRDFYREEGSRKLKALAQWTPRLLYLALVLAIAYKIIQFWSGYFGRIAEIGNF